MTYRTDMRTPPCKNSSGRKGYQPSNSMAKRAGPAGGQVVHHDFGRTKDLAAAPVAALEHFKDGLIRFSGVTALRKRLMLVRVKRPAQNLIAFNTMQTQQLLQLLQGQLHSLMKLGGVTHGTGGQGPFEIVDDRQQFANK